MLLGNSEKKGLMVGLKGNLYYLTSELTTN